MLFQRCFTTAGRDAYFGIGFVPVQASATAGGKVVTVPEGWSQIAVDIMAGKYMRKAGVPVSAAARTPEEGVPAWLWPTPANPACGTTGETDARQVFDRLAGFWCYWGWKLGYFFKEGERAAPGSSGWLSAEASARVLYDELRYMLAAQIFAPASPQWFNAGLNWAYGISGDDCGQWAINHEYFPNGDGRAELTSDPQSVAPSHDPYKRPALSACFIQGVEDNLVEARGIQDLMRREALVFKYGGGSGSNWSAVRGAGEPLSGGGVSSGLMSFLQAPDKSAGAIQSGGTCLAPYTRVYTERGPVPVLELAESGERFACLSYDPPASRYKAKFARAWKSGRKPVVRVVTDKGSFDVSYDHPMKLACGGYKEAGLLSPGQRLFACHIAEREGYLRVSLRTGKRGGGSRYWHRLIAEDLLGATAEVVTDHKDGNKMNNAIPNLELKTQSEHASRHGSELADAGLHTFQVRRFPQSGSANGMSRESGFWKDTERVSSYRSKQSTGIKPRAVTMQKRATRQRMMNVAWRCINAGRDIGTFELYADARRAVVGRIGSVARLRRDIDRLFGSYPDFLNEVNASNHEVVSVETVGEMDVYDVQVDCDTPDARTADSGHNFVIWSGSELTGSGVAVHNTRRAARMLVLDDTHPELEEFTRWKADEEKKVAALSAGSKIVRRHVGFVYAAAKAFAEAPNDDGNPRTVAALKRLRLRMKQGISADVPKAVLDAARIAGLSGAPCPDVPLVTEEYEGGGYRTVSGQNANNSIRVTNDFLTAALDQKQSWHLFGRLELRKAAREGRKPVPMKKVSAAELLRQQAFAAWECGCPGWQYHTTINEWHTCANDGEQKATNPCSEYSFLDDTACNLASLNLLHFFGEQLKLYEFRAAARMVTTVLDITVSAAAYPSEAIADGSRKYRTLGLGYTNLGAVLMRRGLPYDSHEARAFAGHVTAMLHYAAGFASAEMAAELGAFPRYSANADHVARVMRNHAVYGLPAEYEEGYNGLTFEPVPLARQTGYESVPKDMRDDVHEMARHFRTVSARGMRNAQLTLLAPNGTIGLLMDSDTTGVEPDFALVKFKKLAGGGFFKIVNQSVDAALRTLGYSQEKREGAVVWITGHGQFAPGMLRSLREAGVPEEVISKAGAAIPGAMNLADCFAPHVIGVDEYVRAAISGAQTGRAYLSKFLGREQIGVYSRYACGHHTLEGCPFINAAHIPVFNCANRCGKEGAQYLSSESHLRMMAAVQPVLSGAISKTVNYPGDATPEDFRRDALFAWQLGLKAMAGYRDGSKMSQPLNAEGDDAADDASEQAEPITDESAGAFVAAQSGPSRGSRRKLPSRVKGERVKFRILSSGGAYKFYLRKGEYPDGALGEIFIDCHKEGATFRGTMNAFAMAVSIGLQHGVPLSTFVDTFTFTKFEPNGPLKDHEYLKRCDSVFDAIFRELGVHYLKRYDLAHVQPSELAPVSDSAGELVETDESRPVMISTEQGGRQAARERGYTGNRCGKCKQFTLVRAGACEKCDNCGEQSGCA